MGICALLLAGPSVEFVWVLLHKCVVISADEEDLTPYLLGQGQDTKEWKFALSLNGDQLNPFTAGQNVELVDLRSLMADLPVGDLAVAGHAVALSQWHQVHIPAFCLGNHAIDARLRGPGQEITAEELILCTESSALWQVWRKDHAR